MQKQDVFTRKNILVLGGAGFIGSHLCDALVENNNVICVDNFVSGSQGNIDHLLKNVNFEFVKHDLNLPLELEKFPELEKFAVDVAGIAEIYNLACPTSPKEFEQYKLETLSANSTLVKNSLDLALKYQAKLLFASSSVVYGGRRKNDPYFREDFMGYVDFLSERSCYDEGKRFAETMVSTYRQVHKLNTKIARIFRTYGPRMRLYDGQMIPDFIVNALDNKDLVIYGDDTFTSSLTYVSDVVNGLIKIMDSEESGPINLGSIEDYSLAQVAQMIVEMTGSKSKVIYQDPLLMMTSLGLPDISAAREKLGWFPIVSLKDGLEKTIADTKAKKIQV